MHRAVTLFFISLSLYQTSNWLQNTALNFYIYSKAESTLKVGVVQFLQYAPLMFLPFLGGTLIDRLDKYRMFIFTQFTLMILSFVLYLITKDDTESVLFNILCVVIPMGIMKMLDIPLRQTIMAHLVNDKDKLRNATSFYSTIVNFSRFLGPFLFGAVVTFSSAELGFLLSAILLIVNVFLLSFLKKYVRRSNTPSTYSALYTAIFLIQNGDLRNIFVLALIVGLFGWFFYVLLPEYTYKILNLPPHTYGYLTSLAGVGSVLGSLSLLVLKDLRIYTLTRLGILLYALGISLWFASTHFYPLLGLATFLNGFGLSMFYTCANAQVQVSSPMQMKGKILSLYTSIFIGSQPLSFMLGALLDKYLNVWVALLCVLLVFIILALFIKE